MAGSSGNMRAMRRILTQGEHADSNISARVIPFGCGSHQLNLLAKDFKL